MKNGRKARDEALRRIIGRLNELIAVKEERLDLADKREEIFVPLSVRTAGPEAIAEWKAMRTGQVRRCPQGFSMSDSMDWFQCRLQLPRQALHRRVSESVGQRPHRPIRAHPHGQHRESEAPLI